uniref:Uncharacterized protein n=1 Tax=Mola mola TaxID=94237 RepID=A0A3Q3WZL7_MOLML
MQCVKCVLVGDKDAEKTLLLVSYTSKDLSVYVPTVRNFTVTFLMIGSESYMLLLFDTAGTQIDLRDDPCTVEKLAKNKQKPITPENAEKLARDVKAVKYVECSVQMQKGLNNVFDEAILAALEPPEPKKIHNCVLL